jgi:hypothetical protein
MRESVKKMALTGAVVIAMMSFGAQAMAEDLSYSPDSTYSPDSSSTYGNPEEDTGGIVLVDRLAGFMNEWF